MRIAAGICVCLLGAVAVTAQDVGQPLERYRVELDLRKFPQGSPEEALQAVVKAANDRNLNYLMAQLVDPVYVDLRVEEKKKGLSGGSDDARTLIAFDQLVQQIDRHFRNDPSLIQELRRLSREAQWESEGDAATARLPEAASRKAFFKKISGRWYLENRRQ